jgi:hypothetical protein
MEIKCFVDEAQLNNFVNRFLPLVVYRADSASAGYVPVTLTIDEPGFKPWDLSKMAEKTLVGLNKAAGGKG